MPSSSSARPSAVHTRFTFGFDPLAPFLDPGLAEDSSPDDAGAEFEFTALRDRRDPFGPEVPVRRWFTTGVVGREEAGDCKGDGSRNAFWGTTRSSISMSEDGTLHATYLSAAPRLS